jgi:tetratricopeptide (TPR) repeat protein
MKERLKSGDYWGANETAYQRLAEMYPSARSQERLAEIRANRVEFESLKKIRTDAGDDQSQIAEGLRRSQRQRLRTSELDAITQVLHDAGQDITLKIQGLRKYMADHPESESAYSFLGVELLEGGDPEGSIEAYRNAARIAGENTTRGRSARIGIGQALMKKGDLDGAIAEIESILEEAEDEHEVTTACIFLGKAFDRAGRRSEADEAYDLAVRYCVDQEFAEILRSKIESKRAR